MYFLADMTEKEQHKEYNSPLNMTFVFDLLFQFFLHAICIDLHTILLM